MFPSKRFKKRYVSFFLTCDAKPLKAMDAKECIHNHFLCFFGELGVSSLAFKLIRYDEKTGKGILRCERKKVDETIFCMACMGNWDKKQCRLEPVSTSGSIKRA